MALTDAFKLLIDAQLGVDYLKSPLPCLFSTSCSLSRFVSYNIFYPEIHEAQHHRVMPVLAKTQILKFCQSHMGKPIIARMSAKAVDSLYARIFVRASNLRDSYYLIKDNV